MNLVLDAGALIALDRDDRRVAGLIELGRRSAASLVTSAPVVGQAWRDGARQSRLARALRMIDVRDVDLDEAKEAGALLGRTGGSDVVDALVALLARPGDQVLSSDPDDLRQLVEGRDMAATIVRI